MANIHLRTILDTPLTLTIDLDNSSDAEGIQQKIDDLIEKAQKYGAEEIEVVEWDEDEIPKVIACNINPEKWVEYMEAYEEHGDAFRAFVENEHYAGEDISEAVDCFNDIYRGEYKDEEDFAYELLEETGQINSIPESLRNYFDYEAFARDLFISDVYSLEAPGGNIFVFWNN